jgi:endoglucanase
VSSSSWRILAACAVALAIPVAIYCAPQSVEGPPPKVSGSSEQPVSIASDVKRIDEVRMNRYLVVDQFGYTPEMTKVAILASPELGWNALDSYDPGPRIEVRRASDGVPVYQGAPVVWNQGAVDSSSGDRGKWFDFSQVKEPGAYFLYDPLRNERSAEFSVGPNVYEPILAAALRAFYYNRANFAKVKPYACVRDKCWLQGQDYVGPGQDGAARSIRAKDDPSKERDLRGGFWDAGDVNKYVSFAYAPLHQLLSAYDENPSAFGDDLNIPESGNGIPDILDLVQIELAFLKKMQADDLQGGVLPKVGNIEYGDPVPEASQLKRYYYPASCSSAVVSVASVFAHAALIWARFPSLKAEGQELLERSRKAFLHYQSQPRSDACDDGTIHSGDSDVSLADQDGRAVSAAIYLMAHGSAPEYSRALAEHWADTRLVREDRLAVYDAPIADALLYYSTKVKDADPNIAKSLLERVRSLASSSDVCVFKPENSLYRVYMREDSFHWGSNQARANFGNSALLPVVYGLVDGEAALSLRRRAADLLHYFHGQNALGLVMLSNMKSYGAERSVSQIYHAWFRDGDPTFDDADRSTLGPAPGYLVGGVNPSYCSTESDHPCFASSFSRQPREKAYVDTNTGFEILAEFDMSWALSEPAIYYQAAYIKLLSKFAARPH